MSSNINELFTKIVNNIKIDYISFFEYKNICYNFFL